MIKLRPTEKILATERRHWLPMAAESAGVLVAAIVPVFLLIGAEFLPASVHAVVEEYRALGWFLYTALLLGLWMSLAISITNYYLDILVVTNERIIDIEQIGLFSRDIAELNLESIEDIRVEIKGFIASYLNYGNIRIQTAAESQEFAIKNICDPNRVRELVSKEHAVAAART